MTQSPEGNLCHSLPSYAALLLIGNMGKIGRVSGVLEENKVVYSYVMPHEAVTWQLCVVAGNRTGVLKRCLHEVIDVLFHKLLA